jgi:hypothetical protein
MFLVIRLLLPVLFTLAAAHAQAARFDVIDLPGGGKGLLLSGMIGPTDQAAFHAAAAGLNGDVVVTTGPGGSVRAAVAIGSEIRARGWNTLVPPGTDCASACALIWLAGDRRLMADGARIGFHAMSIRKNGVYTETHAPDIDLHRWLNDLGYTEDTTATIVNTPAALVRWLDPIELRANGIEVDLYP